MGKYVNMVMKRFAERKQAIEQNPEASEKDLRGLAIVERFLAAPNALQLRSRS